MSNQSDEQNTFEFDINLAPIIDCLVVLIAFMLASATFLTIGLLDAGVSAAGATPTEGATPPIRIVIELQKNFNYTLKTTGQMDLIIPIESLLGTWNFVGLKESLFSLREKFPSVGVLTLSAQDDIEYKEIIRNLETIRANKFEVLLGEF